ncbi:MAG: hypothetical protein B0D92_06630 [Spirochaeta sp. LUC14_002_19_P3]|nr:MAG: hypothetical protein B0D92_06630 [Spirochaeta sp. LUC14_002_19_P3]
MPSAAFYIYMITYRFSFLFVVCAGILLFSGCQLFSVSDELALIAPTHEGASALGTEAWRVCWLADSGMVQTVSGNLPTFITAARELPVIVAAWPLVSDAPAGWSFKPAGFVQGTGSMREAVELNWQDGFAAELLLELAQKGVDLRRINGGRLAENIVKRSDSKPWLVDRRRLVSDILEGNLWVYSVKLLELNDLVLPLPPGIWYSAWPLADPLTADGSGWSGPLPDGLHLFIRPADGTAVKVWVEGKAPPVLMKVW